MREYDRGGGFEFEVAVDGREFVVARKFGCLPGVVPTPGRGVPLVVAENPRAGVVAGFCAWFREGGRPREVLGALTIGLDGRAPGPTDCENFEAPLGRGNPASPLARGPFAV